MRIGSSTPFSIAGLANYHLDRRSRDFLLLSGITLANEKPVLENDGREYCVRIEFSMAAK